MDKTIYLVSDCCYVESNPDYQVCSCCGEHCEMIVDDSIHAAMMDDFIESDYIPGFDDGEAI
jgi:hypothetical protein